MSENLGSNADDFFKNLAGQAWKTHREVEKVREENSLKKYGETLKPEDETAKRLLTFMILGLIAFVGVEPAKAVLRRNMGKGAINHIRLFIACSFFFFCGLIAVGVAIAFFIGKIDPSGNAALIDGGFSYLLTGILYVFFSGYAFIKAQNAGGNNIPYNYQGDSVLLKYLPGWNNSTAKWLAEPVAVILTGIIFSLFINIPGGIPIVISGLSMWAYAIMELFFFGNHMKNTVLRKNMEMNQNETFNKVEA